MEDKLCYKFNTKHTHYVNEISALSGTGKTPLLCADLVLEPLDSFSHFTQ